jgi:hypothetical protein
MYSRMYLITESGEEYLAAGAEACKQFQSVEYQSIMACFYQACTSR